MPESFLLEIGVEELPARLCPLGLEQLRARGEALLAELRLAHAGSRTCGTPRRLAWLVEGLAERQADTESVARGPARSAAFTSDGQPTRAAEGFARAQGMVVADLSVEALGDREYVFARRRLPGLPAAEVLGPALPGLIASLDFPRTMRWGTGQFRFPRPIRWLVALLGPQIVPCAIEELSSGRTSFGHRTLSPGPLLLGRPEEYMAAMRAAGVLVDVQERRRTIWAGIAAAAAAVEGQVRPDEDLLDEVTHINEWPTGFVGGFDPAALEVPAPVLVTVMRSHQRYFSVQDADGNLLPFFAGVRNGGREHLPVVVAGNEKVLAARFADARFFYTEDRREPLEARVSRLDTVAFAEGLGTLADKTRRLEALAAALAARVGADAAVVRRAARLCKADRLTHIVYELPELEGTMGARYAAADGEPDAVASAIGEHVLPRAAGGELPSSPAGLVLALADRLDTLAGHFLLGRAPSGSADPLGLRRAGSAVVRILEGAGWDLSVATAVQAAVAGYPAGMGDAAALPEFLAGRLRGLLEESGFRHDVCDAVLAVHADQVARAGRSARAVTEAMAAPGWPDTVTAFKRAANLARQGEPGAEVETAVLGHETERALLAALAQARRSTAAALAAADDGGVLRATAALRRPVDDFLAAVLVMDPDPRIRRSRLALLAAVAAVPMAVADLGRLQGG